MVKKKAIKHPVKKKLAEVKSGPRVRNLTRKQRREKAKKEVGKRPEIPGSFKLSQQVFKTMRTYWKPLGRIFLVYLILNIVLASGLGNINNSVNTIKNDLSKSGHHLSTGFSGLGTLLGSAWSGGSGSSSAMQSILLIIGSLVIIWALRQLLANKQIKVKQAYYSSMFPLIPFVLVAAVIIIQLLPITVGAKAVQLVLSSAVTSSTSVTVIFSLIFAILACWSFYMLSSSVFALYIVTLPDMQPRQALRSAKKLVSFRRWSIMRRLIFLPVLVFAIIGLLTIPLVLFATFLAAPLFYFLSVMALVFIHTYMYSLYRSLL